MKGEKQLVRPYAFAENDGYVMVTDGQYRYIKGADASLLFDEVKDPKNLNDISGKFPDIVKMMSVEIDNWVQKTAPSYPRKSM